MNSPLGRFASALLTIAALCLAASPAQAQQCASGDFNRDGKSDTFWLHATLTQTTEWQMNGTAIGTAGLPASTGDTGWQVKGMGDFDGDGKADVMFRHSVNGATFVWLMNGMTVASSGSPGTIADLGWQVQGVGDFDGDGKADTLWMHTDGTVQIWKMNGALPMTLMGTPAVLGAASGWVVQGVGDFGGDGKADILWKHSNGTVVLWQMNGAAISNNTAITGVGPESPTNWQVQGIGDFNGDGKADILWRNDNLGGIIYVWLMNGAVISSATSVTGVGTEAAQGWVVKSIGDYNGDGKADVLWKNDTQLNGIVYVWLMNGAAISLTGAPTGVADTGWLPTSSRFIAPCPAMSPTLATSRTTGVAPLAVFFDATGASTATPGKRTFRDIEYRWNFGDPLGSIPGVGETTWHNGAQAGVSSRNTATGPLAAHVFETPGTYTVTMTAVDGVNTATNTVQIVVSDPDVVFAGNKTVCVSVAPTDFTGCPAGSTQTTVTTFNQAVALINSTTKRLLFRRGQTFNIGSGSTFTPAIMKQNGPGIIGSFGPTPGTTAKIKMNATTAKGAGNPTGLPVMLIMSDKNTPTIGDWRIMDLEFDGSNVNNVEATSVEGSIKQVTMLRLNIHDTGGGISFAEEILDYYNHNGNPGHLIFDQIAIQDSNITHTIGPGSGPCAIFLSARRLMIMGNFVDDTMTGAEHILRIEYASGAVISNNTLSRPAATKHTIKLHSTAQGQVCTTELGYSLPCVTTSPATNGFTENVVISDNKFVGSAGVDWTVAIAPQNSSYDERLRDILVERNLFIAGTGTETALYIAAAETTVRNNVFVMTTAAFHNSVTVARRGPEPVPTQIRIFNNTAYSASTGDFPFTYLASSGINNVFVQNNLALSSTASGALILDNAGGATAVTNTNNTFNNNPGNFLVTGTPSSSVITDFKLKAGSPAINAGTLAAPVFSDLFGVNRPNSAARDLGAAEF